jgi:hypothetical protein
LGYSASGSSTASAESSVTQAVWKYLICGSMPVPSFDVAKNGGKRVGSCGPKRFWSKLIVDVGVEVGFNGFHRILSFLCRSWSLNSTPGAREQKTADLHRWAVGVSNWRTFVYQLPPVTSEVRGVLDGDALHPLVAMVFFGPADAGQDQRVGP